MDRFLVWVAKNALVLDLREFPALNRRIHRQPLRVSQSLEIELHNEKCDVSTS